MALTVRETATWTYAALVMWMKDRRVRVKTFLDQPQQFKTASDAVRRGFEAATNWITHGKPDHSPSCEESKKIIFGPVTGLLVANLVGTSQGARMWCFKKTSLSIETSISPFSFVGKEAGSAPIQALLCYPQLLFERYTIQAEEDYSELFDSRAGGRTVFQLLKTFSMTYGANTTPIQIK